MNVPFDVQKATQAINYFAEQNKGVVNKMKALKLLFFADRYHLRKYGRPVVGDSYVAMKYGPVASTAKDVAEGSDFLDEEARLYAAQYIEAVNPDRHFVRSVQSLDEDVFSKSDLEALAFAQRHFAAFDEFALAEMTHRYPEWRRHQVELQTKNLVPMRYVDFFENPDHLPDDPFKEDPTFLSAMCDLYLQDREAEQELAS